MWLSSAVLLPLGIFFTYKAVGDSAVFNVDAYRNFFNTLIGRAPRRNLELKEVVMRDVVPEDAVAMIAGFDAECRREAEALARKNALMRLISNKGLHHLKDRLNDIVDYLSNSRDRVVVNLLNNYPFNITSRNIGAVIENNRSLTERISQDIAAGDEKH